MSRRSKNFQPDGEPWRRPVERKPHISAEEIIRRAWVKQRANRSTVFYDTNLSRPGYNMEMAKRLVQGIKHTAFDASSDSPASERLPFGYESTHAREKRERAARKARPVDLLAQLALETCGEPIRRHQTEPGEIDRGSYRHRLNELQNRIKQFPAVEPIYLDEGWY